MPLYAAPSSGLPEGGDPDDVLTRGTEDETMWAAPAVTVDDLPASPLDAAFGAVGRRADPLIVLTAIPVAQENQNPVGSLNVTSAGSGGQTGWSLLGGRLRQHVQTGATGSSPGWFSAPNLFVADEKMASYLRFAFSAIGAGELWAGLMATGNTGSPTDFFNLGGSVARSHVALHVFGSANSGRFTWRARSGGGAAVSMDTGLTPQANTIYAVRQLSQDDGSVLCQLLDTAEALLHEWTAPAANVVQTSPMRPSMGLAALTDGNIHTLTFEEMRFARGVA